jgi:hypothetical protein
MKVKRGHKSRCIEDLPVAHDTASIWKTKRLFAAGGSLHVKTGETEPYTNSIC